MRQYKKLKSNVLTLEQESSLLVKHFKGSVSDAIDYCKLHGSDRAIALGRYLTNRNYEETI